LASLTICRSRNVGEDDGDDESVESESLSENEDQDHSDKDIFLSVCAHTCVTDDADGETGSQGWESAAEARGQVLVASVDRVRVVGWLSVIRGWGDYKIIFKLVTPILLFSHLSFLLVSPIQPRLLSWQKTHWNAQSCISATGAAHWIKAVLTLSLEDDGHNKSVDTEDTSHDNWDEGLEDQIASENTHAADTDTGLRGTVSGSQVGEHEGGSQAHESEEGVLIGVVGAYQKANLVTKHDHKKRRRASVPWRGAMSDHKGTKGTLSSLFSQSLANAIDFPLWPEIAYRARMNSASITLLTSSFWGNYWLGVRDSWPQDHAFSQDTGFATVVHGTLTYQ
jgi:hypothetical protein